jgi:hypothetical protein
MMFHWYLTPVLHVRSSLSSVVVRGRTSLMNLCVLSQVRVLPKTLNHDDFHIAYYLPSAERVACLALLRTWKEVPRISRLKTSLHAVIFAYYIPESGMSTGYELDDGGATVPVPIGSRILTSPSHPNQLWGLSCEYRG